MEVRVLGPVEARRDGVPVHLNARMNRALLAILVLERGGVVAADRLVDLLWDGTPPPKATAALHTKVAHLRRALQPDRAPRSEDSLIRTSPAGYRIAREDVDLDADRFERLVGEARGLVAPDPRRALGLLDDALGLWRGPALAEFADQPFAEAFVQRLESLRLTAVELRAAARLGAGDTDRAVDELQPHVAAHPLREQARAQLARALYLAGRQADALAVLAEGRALLREELGLDPGPELQRLEQQILDHDPALAPALPAAPVPANPPVRSVRRPELVGRDAECALLDTVVAEAAAGSGCVVLVSGDAGMGKSALLASLAAGVAAAGGPVRSATCRDGVAAPPFWPVLQIVREAAAAADEAGRARLAAALGPLAGTLPDPGRPAVAATGGADPAMVLVHLADALAAALARPPGVPALVALDDLHAADPATLRLVAALAAEVATAPTVLALALRSGEAADSRPLADALAALGRLPRVVRLDLAPLPPDAVTTLIAGSLDGADADVDGLVARAGGNPFFALELARAAAAGAGSPGAVGGRPVGGVPAPVYDVLRQRFLRLPPEGLELLTAAAVAGEPLPADDLAAIRGVPVDEALDLLEGALAARLLADTGDGGFTVAHALVGEALRASLSSARLARLHRAVAMRLEARAGDDPQAAARIAAHHLAARTLDGGAAALPWLERASDTAVGVAALDALRELNEQLVALVGPADRRRELRARSRIAYADVWSSGYDTPAIREFLRMVRGWSAPRPVRPDDLELLWVAAMLEGQVGRLDDAAGTVARMAEAAAEVDDATARYLHEDMAAVIRWREARFAEALAHLDRAEQLVDAGGVDLGRSLAFSPRTRIAVVRAHCFWHQGRRAEAFAQAEAAVATAEETELGAAGFARRWSLVLALMDGDPGRVRRLVGLRPGAPSWERLPYPAAVVGFAQAWLRAVDDPAAGLPGMREAHAALVRHGLAGGRSVLLGLLAEVALRAGDPAAAGSFCEAGLAVASLAERYWVPSLQRIGDAARQATASGASAATATVSP
ncbi:BTAD domain-containing putative transcriptional regulator [Blastococcus sp. SYSU D00669]